MLRIAVVEDHLEEAETLLRHLDRYQQERNVKFQSKHFSDGVVFINGYHSTCYDIVFMDITIKLDNYCSHPLKFRDGLPVSSDEKSGYHGFGTKSIQHITGKYGGILSIRQNLDIKKLYS